MEYNVSAELLVLQVYIALKKMDSLWSVIAMDSRSIWEKR